MNRTPILATLILLAALHSSLQAADLAATANLSGGVACFLNPPDASEALTLAQHGRFLVLVTHIEAAKVVEFRKQALDAGVLGRSLYVEQCEPTALPLADHVVDLLISPVSGNQAEMMRVLAPVRGKAFLGNQIVTKPALPHSDDWTHRLHRASNNPVSQDTAFQGPAMLQYLAMPMQTSFQGTMLVAAGRRIELSDWVTKKQDRNDVAGILRARSLYNGQPLWERPLPKKIEPDMPICALEGDRIYLAADDGCKVFVIDAETGKDVTCLQFSEQEQLRINWLAIENGRLYALVGKPLQTRPRLRFPGGRANRGIRLKHASAGEGLVSWDIESGQELWRHEERTTIDYRTLAVREGRVYFYSEASRLACLDCAGELVWENRNDEWLGQLKRPLMVNPNHEAAGTLIVGPSGHLRLTLAGVPVGFLFDAASGKLLWQDRLKAPKCLFLDKRYLTPAGIFEADTGARIGESGMEIQGSGCGIVTWVPALEGGLSHVAFGVKSPCGVGAYAAGGMLSFAPSQCDCWPHQRGAAGFASGAELLQQVREHPQHPLIQGTDLQSTHASAEPTRSSVLDWPQYRGGIKRPGNSEVSVGESAQLLWHSKPEQLLSVPPGHEMHRDTWLDRPTPPVTAGNTAYYASSDGSIRAVDLADGKTVWTYWTGGAVLSAPAVNHERIYAGSNDGWVYCLHAHSGKLLWKWRGAPADRRVIMYGKLTSLWPVTSVMVSGDKVFGVAGQAMQNGSITFALDAATGEARWTTWTEPAYESRTILERPDFGFGPAGQLTQVGRNLIVRTYLGIPAVFHAESGKRIPPSDEYRQLCQDAWAMGFRTATSGQDLVVLDDQTVIQGGHPILSNPDLRHDKSAAKFIAWRIHADGQIPVRPLPLWAIPHSQIAPALDNSHIAMVGGVGRSGRSADSTIGLSLWSRATWRAAIEQIPETTTEDTDAVDPSAPKFQHRRAEQAALQAEIRRFNTTLDMRQAQWRIDEADVNAVALCKNAVVAVLGERSFARRRGHPGFTGWKLVAIDRNTSQQLWEVQLPAEPVFNGIAPTSAGSWVLTLRDGSLIGAGD